MSNFAIGAVLMMELASIAGKYLIIDLIESHHENKIDAPSNSYHSRSSIFKKRSKI